jgi:hypothetical protein
VARALEAVTEAGIDPLRHSLQPLSTRALRMFRRWPRHF